jgi:GTP:adenosylcobinamide-phosphate guanylyltransferase
MALGDAAPATIDAIVLAGGPHDAIARHASGAPNKAFVPVAGRTLVERTIAALRASPLVGTIVVVAPPETFASHALRDAHERREAGSSMARSLHSGVAGFPADGLLLVAASDLPILSRAAIDEFIGLAHGTGADLVYACVERGVHDAAFPGVPHTWASLADGTFCGGGIVALRPRVLPALEGLLGRLGRARKNPLALAAIFGPQILTRYVLGRLRIVHAERRASELVGARVAATVCTHPEIAVNVDRESDLAVAERLVYDQRLKSSFSMPN